MYNKSEGHQFEIRGQDPTMTFNIEKRLLLLFSCTNYIIFIWGRKGHLCISPAHLNVEIQYKSLPYYKCSQIKK